MRSDNLPRPDTPAEALHTLMAGNRRFITDRPRGPNRSRARVAALAGGQSPWAAVLGCADSRVPLEILFDAGFGDLFAVRVAGNVASAEQIGSLEYAVAILHTPLVMVLGHTSCGAVQAALDGVAAPGRIPALLRHVLDGLPAGESDPGRAAEANVRHQLAVLRRESPVLQEHLAQGTVMLAGAIVDLATGEVRVLETVPATES